MPEAPRETSVLEHEVRVAAPPEIVFAYFTDPARMVQWFGEQATLDPRPGGVCRIAFQAPPPAVVDIVAPALGEGAIEAAVREELAEPGVMMGEFVEVEPYRRLVISWGWESQVLAVPPQSTVVEVSLTPDGDDTILRLVHRRLPDGTHAFHRAGWEHYLDRLATLAGGTDPGPDPTAWRDMDTVRAVLRDFGGQ
jgi:uncharacterized protein YndB with AHSA1/START domain